MAALWWVRRDMRLADNPALLEAQADGPAAAVFPWSPPIHFWSGRRRAHLARVLWALREETHGALAVRKGPAHEAIPAAALEAGARVVWAQREFFPASIVEQDLVAASLAEHGIELRLLGSAYLVDPGTLLTKSGTPFQVFTPFARAWREYGWEGPAPRADPARFVPLPALSPSPLPSGGGMTGALDVSLDHEAARGDGDDLLAFPAEFREDRWHARLEDFANTALADYKEDRDVPGIPGTSRLSVALAFGQLHPRTIATAVLARPAAASGASASGASASGASATGASAFINQLAWRDFHADTLLHHPEALRVSLKPVMPDDSWETGRATDQAFQAWRDGRTGFPLVDAGMRELAATGTMHNRVRMVVASFLVKDLHLPWQRGAAYFRHALLDYDHAQNQLNWQWVAGTGRDAAPFFRVFNPQTQAARYDPDLAYVRRWVAELDTPAYPAPMLDHAQERERALADYRQGKGQLA